MNILYLFGNGFDINIGMKTRYTDFYKFYNKVDSSSELIKKLKKEISVDIMNWSDLEIALGNYTAELKDIKDFDEIYEDILNNLCDYLEKVFNNFDFTGLDLKIFLKDLCQPELFLADEDIREFKEYRQSWGRENSAINIINFNYTHSVESIIGEIDLNSPIGIYNQSNFYLQEIVHIHGFTNERTILGVNDITQLKNIDLKNDNNFIEAFIKTESNSLQRHNIDKKCQNYIKSANIICIFGCSLGETDKFWWQLIAENLKRNIKLIIFFRGVQQNRRLPHKTIRIQREVKNHFLNMSNLTDEEKELIEKNIYISINSEIFKLF